MTMPERDVATIGCGLPGPGLGLRPLRPADVPGLLAVQRACYGDGLIEGEAVFVRRLASAAQCSLALVEADGPSPALVAYLAAYRSRRGAVTPFEGDFHSAPQADALYLHDLAVAPAWAGRGLAQGLLAAAWQRARAEGLRHSALVSVQGTQAFWERQGYGAQPLADAAQQRHLDSYGTGAVYMVRAL
jgi:ribosomal protein S18 acetylase RimI-like enzyme